MNKIMVMAVCMVVLAGAGSVKAELLGGDDFEWSGDLGTNADWTDLGGNWHADGNKAYCNDYTTDPLARYDTYQQFSSTPSGYKEIIVARIREWKADERWAGVAMHIQSAPNTYYQVRLYLDRTPGILQIFRRDNNTAIAEGEYAPGFSWGWYTIEATTDNAGHFTATAYANDGTNVLLSISGTDSSPLTDGYAGIWGAYSNAIQKWDDFTISNNVPPPTGSLIVVQ